MNSKRGHARIDRSLRLAAVTLSVALLGPAPVEAAIRIWGGAGGNGNWSTAGNWTGGVPPVNGDDVLFQSGAANLTNTNNLSNLQLNSITFTGSGYTIRGNPIVVANGISGQQAAGANTFEIAVTLGAAQTFDCITVGASQTLSGNVTNGGFTLTVGGSGSLTASGVITGAGGLVKNGTGTNRLAGAFSNTYTGPTTVKAGTMELAKNGAPAATAIPGDLVIGDGVSSATVRNIYGLEIADTADLTINANGLWDLNNWSETVGSSLTLAGGDIQSGSGTATLSANATITVSSSPDVSGKLNIGTGTCTIQGSGTLYLRAVVSGAANIVKNGSVSLLLYGANTFTGTLTANNSGYVYLLNDLSLGATNGGTILNDATHLYLWDPSGGGVNITNEPLTLNSSYDYTIYIFGPRTNTWSATNFTLAADASIYVETNSVLELSGPIGGAGGLTKYGPGRLVFSGSSHNTYSGLTLVNEGELDLNKADYIRAIPPSVLGLEIGDGTGVDVVKNLNGHQLWSVGTPVKINRSGVMNLNGYTDTAAPLTMNGGQVTTGAGLVWLYRTITVLTNANVATIVGNAYLDDSVVITNAGHWCDPSLRIDASISGSSGAGLTITGPGDVELTAPNSFTGPTSIDAGMLWLTHSSALGNTNTTCTVNPGGTLFLDGNLTIGNKPLVLAGSGWMGLGAVWANRGSSSWGGAITLSNLVTIDVDTNLAPTATLTLTGLVGGPGGLTKLGPGALALAGSSENTYTGPTVHNQGLLLLAKTGTAHSINYGSLFIGGGVGGIHADIVRYTGGNNQIMNTVPITITNSGWLDLNGRWDDLGPITLIGGDIDTGAAGLIYAQGDITVRASAQIAHLNGQVMFESGLRTITVDHGPAIYNLEIPANLSDAGSGFNLASGATQGAFVRLMGSNSFTGPLTVMGLTADAETPWSLGATNGPTIVRNNGQLFLFKTGITNEPLTLDAGTYLDGQGDCVWAGPITLTGDTTILGTLSTGLLDIIGPIGGTGNLTSLTAGGTNRFSGAQANTYVGTTTAGNGTLVLNKSVANGAIPGNLVVSGNVRLAQNLQLADSADVLINSGGVLDLATRYDYLDTLRGSGSVAFGTSGYLHVGGNNGTSTFDGVMSGPGYAGGYTLYKFGTGTFTLNGNNTYSNRTHVAGGKLVINGSQPQSPVRVYAGGTVGGSGTVGGVVAAGGVSPGASPGLLTCSNLALLYSGTPGNFQVELTGPVAGTDYDQLNVRGTNNLASAALNLNLAFTKPVAVGQQFTIINNDGTDPIVGTFAGYPEGSSWVQNGFKVVLSYVGGTGNDVVLTLTEVPGASAGYAASSGNGNGVLEPNECAALTIGVTNNTDAPMTGVTATLSSSDPNVLITQPLATYPDVPGSGQRTNSTPFQVSILPSLVCGHPINLQLAVSTASHGSFAVPVVLPSGTLSATPARFDNNTVTNVPDIGTIESTNTVAAWSGGTLAKIAVSLWLVAPWDADLNLTLIAPDGTSVDLSSGNGAGANFGSGNADASRTTFDDEAAISITAGTPPFVGSFRPEGTLASLLSSPAVGNWRLRIQDNFGYGVPDTLRAWSLFLYGTSCAPGGGACALCAGGTLLTNTLDTTGATLSPRLRLNGVVGTCAVPKGCPGTIAGTFYYQAYPFYNASSNTCVTVTLTSLSSGNLTSSAYLGEFTPGNVCLNYLADAGFSTGGPASRTYSFNVPPDSLFTVVVNNAGALGPYTLAVSGGDCPPVLSIQPLAGPNVNVNWPVVGGGYQLEKSTLVSPTSWSSVSDIPVAVSGRFNVTNDASGSTRFYRLHKQ